ncbi:spore coat protein [Caldibacillus lycopersici]|uniref:Spore coat protein n=1 Tax=Perspicuibacillus lycopersici TaxID=1325689 RepID=A0AAE3LNS8_9BACI|nr:spore coat protein [Perspicuibacillus lycopersici]MCU9615055.1 spore coat protein [Perspicuibacillus lycopersici]
MMGLLKNLMGMKGMTDQVIATDFLISTKSGVINTALALTESATPELRAELERQLFQTIDTHDAISNYMIAKGYYHPQELREQLSVDLQTAKTAIDLSDSIEH